MMTPDVSIVIAAWNAEAFIGEAIRSALGQVGISLEVIVANDASTDATREVVRAFDDPRVRLVDLERNGGPSAARNAGFNAATGRWIAVLDADDGFKPDRLRRMIALGDARQADAVVDNLEVLKAGEAPRPMFPEALLSGLSDIDLPTFILSNRLFADTYNLGYTKPVFRRTFLVEHAIAYDTDIRIGEDYIFLADLLAAGGRCVVDHALGYRYTINAGSISRVLKPRDVEIMLAADDRFLSRHRLAGAASDAMARRRQTLHEGLAFLNCVEQLKTRRPLAAIQALVPAPAAIFLFRLPVVARFKRLFAVS